MFKYIILFCSFSVGCSFLPWFAFHVNNLEYFEKLPLPTVLVSINVADGMKTLHPLPEEELTTSYNQGNAYLITGQFEKALFQFDKALSVAPDNADIHLSRGIVYEKLNRWQDAIDDYKLANTIFKKRPFSRDDPTAFSNLANAETGLGQWDDALRDYSYASKLDPNFVAPQLGRNLVLYQLGRPTESIAYFKSVVAKYPFFADGQAALAVMMFEEGGKDEDVIEAWEIAVEQDSRYIDVDWVRDIRRWPPALVQTLEKFKQSDLYKTITM